MSKKNAGYKLDLAHQTLTLTAAFADAANNPASDEYNLVRQFQHDFPNLKIVYRTHATPTSYNGKMNGDKRTPYYPTKNLSYERMEKFMDAFDGGQKYRNEYDKLRKAAEAMCLAPYMPVARWFMAQFPEFRKDPLYYTKPEHLPDVIDYATFLEKVA